MKLIYRGITYDYDPTKRETNCPVEHTHTSQTPYELIYRGHKYWVDPNAICAKPSVQPVTYELFYRGISYLAYRNEHGELTAIVPSSQFFKKNRLRSIFSSLFAN